jgi:hypothetical protein
MCCRYFCRLKCPTNWCFAGHFVREIPHEQMENSLGVGGSAAENQRIPACSDALSTEKLWEKLIIVERWKLGERNDNCVTEMRISRDI